MEPESSLKWLFLDLNSYFASVEQQENPSLRGKPVVVVPMDTDSTCAIAASYEAKAYGIKTQTRIYEAKQMCPNLHCVTARHDIYVLYHHRIIEEVVRHVPINKEWSIDELSSCLPPRLRSKNKAIAVSHRIKEGIWNNIGSAISCSIGIAPNSFLAKVATNMQKPDGLVIIEPKNLPGPLLKLNLTDLPGINLRMESRLNRCGIFTLEQFWNLSPKHARKVWGSVQGERFWYNLHGYDIPAQQTKTSVFSHSRVLDLESRYPDSARQVTRQLTVKAATRLRHKKFYATRFSISVRDLRSRRWSAEVQLSPSHDDFSFLHIMEDIWANMILELQPYKLKKVSVALHGLCRYEHITPDLFKRSSTCQVLQRKNNNLSDAVDILNKKFGAKTIQIGACPIRKSDYVGSKISFTRIPEISEFSE